MTRCWTNGLTPRLRGSRPLQDLFRGDMLQQLILIHEICRRRFALAKKLFRLIVPMTAFLMIALAEGNDRI